MTVWWILDDENHPPIRLGDLDALVEMAESAGAGFTSLPPVPEFLQAKIELSEASFAKDVLVAGHERYMFVMEETTTGEIGAACAIEAACGLDEAFYNYRVGIAVHASRVLGIYNKVPTLYLSNDLTGTSVFVLALSEPAFRGAGAASCCRSAASCSWRNSPIVSPTRSSPKCAACPTRPATRRSGKGSAAFLHGRLRARRTYRRHGQTRPSSPS